MTDEEPTPRMLLGGLGEVLADLDTVLPDDPEAVVRAFTQAGGNGGGEAVALLQEWIGSLGPVEAGDVMAALRAVHPDARSESVDDRNPSLEADLAGSPFNPYMHGWGYQFLCLRYGFVTASYWLNAELTFPELLHAGAGFLGEDSTSLDRHLKLLQLEQRVRLAERQQRFAVARTYLEQVAATGGDRVLHLLDEYKHLLAAPAAELADPASSAIQVQRIHMRVKELVAPVPMYEAERRAREQVDLGVDDPHEAEADVISEPRARQATPVSAGQTLETAALALLRRLFDLSQDQAAAFPPLLRRQRGGYQFGHDLSFDAAVAGMEHVRCHVECKNYGDPIRTSDIADKLLQQKLAARTAPIDHWILISPHSDPANDLQELLRTWEETEEWGFSVQVWSPQSGVRELFSIAPDVYRALYDADPPAVDTPEVTREFLDRIAPRLRIPRAFRAYLRDPWRMCFAVEDAGHFTSLLDDHTDIGAVDAAGRALDQKLLDVVLEWLREPIPEAMLILGEFGDGKSFFTFLLCRLLARDFLAEPNTAIYPVRLALKDLRQVGSPDALIERWLRGIGATPAEWAELAASRRTLIVLDGFDEMTTALDPPTIQENLELLSSALETLAGPMTEANKGRKAIVTSRGRFFDQPREESALRERLGHPQLNRIRPLSRVEVLANLSRYANRIGAQEKLTRIRTLYDPIGLAAKPLFLQMIKETLQDLPNDEFDATTLYETYIDRSLRRKSALLLSRQPYELAADVIDRLRKILERVAVELHLRSTDSVDLRAVSPDGEMAALLWQMTDQAGEGSAAQEVDHDARMRVAIRSLLRPIPADDDTWQVAFFHRSVMEYFLAAAITHALTGGDAASVREILDGNALSIETMDFVLQRLSDQQRDAAADLLVTLALSARRGGELKNFLGGNAVSLCYLIAETLPDADWRGLNLDGVRLVGADLRSRDFSESSLRYANFDNADLRDANLSDTDLTGLRIEQTTQVTAVAIDTEASTVLVAYSDGTIREWSPTGTRWSGVIVASALDNPAIAIMPLTAATALAVTAHEALILARTRPHWTISCRTPRSPFLVGTTPSDSGIYAVHVGSPRMVARWDIAADSMSLLPVRHPLVNDAMYPLTEGGAPSRTALVSGEWLVSSFFVGDYVGPRLWHIPTGRVWNLPHMNISAFTVAATGTSPVLLVGTSEGRLWNAPVVGDGPLDLIPVSDHSHDGPITCVTAHDASLVATGGADRCVRLWQTDKEAVRVIPMYLTLRCAGARLNGVEGARERSLLQSLAVADAAESTGMGDIASGAREQEP